MQAPDSKEPTGHAHRSTRAAASSGLSFVRRPAEQRIVSILVDDIPVAVDLNATALIVIDMQNDFCHPDGWFAQKGTDIAPITAVIPQINALVGAVRASALPVIWLNWGVRADRANLPLMFAEKGARNASPTYSDPAPSGRGRILVRDEWGAATVDAMTVDASDLLVHKHRLSGFWDNELDSILRLRGITTLLFAGINIDRCVFSTLQDASFLGYDCMLVDDCCATVSPAYVRDAILFLIRQLHGVVTTSDAVFTALGPPEPASPTHRDNRSAS
ncbi:cysteine hydrolase family protein [Pseudorhodoplanes sinuspersici]|uniref:Uncharacterized protein n=1 Tax=Pseudorhodoplanes sinuspersici TaxID=1235591 RepID=A0A1W6ZNM9_9HYPH|nr:cysteine hydrolase family protein [Pseudorhodoplanes sinuspersici]ARP99008.1 hypothetical protein CAK95_07880 [Pseudorhodoplanes sinuspersici]RKE69351.1 nicotinamidase-related amidase [Pseudorhodoplanes sinuspersici]